MVSDFSAVLVLTVIVGYAAAAAEIDPFAHVRVADIRKMCNCGARAYIGIFYLDVVAYLAVFADYRPGSHLAERSDFYAVFKGCRANLGRIDLRSVSDFAVLYIAVRTDYAVFTDFGTAPKNRSGKNCRSRSDLNRRLDDDPVGADEVNAPGAELFKHRRSRRGVKGNELEGVFRSHIDFLLAAYEGSGDGLSVRKDFQSV